MLQRLDKERRPWLGASNYPDIEIATAAAFNNLAVTQN
jgi:hypothetical protein